MLSTFSDQVINFIEDTKVGTELSCAIDVSSREWKGRYFTEARCFKVETYRNENTDYYPQKEKAKVEEKFSDAGGRRPAVLILTKLMNYSQKTKRIPN